MPRKQPGIVDEFPFLLIEEGIKKNYASERLRQYLSTKMSQRAEIEMKYIKQLQYWLDDFNPFYNQDGGSEVYMDSDVVKTMVTGLKNDVINQMTIRQKMYNDLMSDGGAYNMMNQIRAHCQNGKDLDHLTQEFSVINDRKRELFEQHKTINERKSHFANEIEELERQLAQRSRIVTNRRGTERGAKRIDEMKNRVSILRRQNGIEADKVSVLEKELFSMGASSKMTLESLDKQLQELEDKRIRAVLNNVKLFLNVLQGYNSQSTPPTSFRGKQKLNDLEGIENLLKCHWTDVKTNAKRTEAGETFKLRELFTVKNQKPKVVFRPEADDGRDSRMSGTLELEDSPEPKKKRGGFFSRKSKKETGTPSPEPYSNDGRKSRLYFNESVTDLGKKGRTPPTAKSDESIEELELPPEIWCTADVTRQQPNKQFLNKKNKQKTKEVKLDIDPHPTIFAPTEYSHVSEYTIDDSDEDLALGRLRNVRVVAERDNLVAPSGSELPFRKGQIIKQKVGRNEDGFCYGWTRDHPMSRKRYGYYRLCMVRRYDNKPDSADDNSE